METIMSLNKRFLTFSILVHMLHVISLLTLARASSVSFSTNLIHRDSPTSPFYDPSLTLSRRVVIALNRSFDRARYFSSFLSGTTDIYPSTEMANYLMRISIGTPPQEIVGVVDTGSSLIWTQCEPCSNCFDQDSPIYDPRASSSYNTTTCDSTTCMSFPMRSCVTSNNTCLYLVAYGDLSFSSGELATDTFTMNSTTNDILFVFKNMVFGCGHRNGGMFSEDQSGIIGLGRGPFSFITQIGSSINGKFSYCLVQMFTHVERSSKIYFGDVATVSGNGVVSTPILSGYPDRFYYLNFQGITVRGQRVDFYTQNSTSVESNIIIDSGTSLTLVPEEFYNRLQLAVRRSMEDIEPVSPDEQISNISLCYNPQEVMGFPNMVAHFHGADLELDPMNTFVRISDESICLAFAPVDDGVAIYGNIAQMNFLVGYDVYKNTVSFKRTDCTML